jgi:hypothetical protein
VDESYDTAEDLLVRNRTLLDKLSKELIEVETVDAKHLMRLIEEYAVGDLSCEQSPPSRSMVTEGKRVTVCRARKLSQDRHTRSVVSVNGRNITRCLRDSERCEAYTEIPERAARQHSGDDRRRSDSEARTGGERTARARHRSIAALTRGIGGAGLVVGERRRNELGQLLSDGLRERLARLAPSPTEARRP